MNHHVLIKKFSKIMTKIIKKREKRAKRKLIREGKSTGRPNKFSIMFYVMQIIDVLVNGTAWNKLNLRNSECKKLITGDAIRKKFNKWNEHKIFDEIHNKLLESYKRRMAPNLLDNMYLDSAVIPNVNNSDLAEYSYKYPNKKSIKINAICDEKKIIHSIFFSPSNTNDSKLIINPVNKLKTLPDNLVADAGYITDGITLRRLRLKGINFITNKRRNMRVIIPEANKRLLKKRVVIEHTFSLLKRRYRRFQNIYDRSVNILVGMAHIAVSIDLFILANG
jgi:hypothetical protein